MTPHFKGIESSYQHLNFSIGCTLSKIHNGRKAAKSIKKYRFFSIEHQNYHSKHQIQGRLLPRDI